MVVESVKELVEVVARELPVERFGDLLVVAGEPVQSLLDCVEVGEVVRGQRFALTINKESSIWFSHEACPAAGSAALSGRASAIRCTDAVAAVLEPLCTTAR